LKIQVTFEVAKPIIYSEHYDRLLSNGSVNTAWKQEEQQTEEARERLAVTLSPCSEYYEPKYSRENGRMNINSSVWWLLFGPPEVINESSDGSSIVEYSAVKG
jgi:hypothetical protein